MSMEVLFVISFKPLINSPTLSLEQRAQPRKVDFGRLNKIGNQPFAASCGAVASGKGKLPVDGFHRMIEGGEQVRFIAVLQVCLQRVDGKALSSDAVATSGTK